MLASRLLETPIIITNEMSQEEIDHEWELMLERGRMTQKFVDGEIDPETYFDFMAQQGYEPAELMEAAEENLEFAQAEGIVVVK